MNRNSYLAQWSKGFEKDETLEKIEGADALELYKKILKSTESIRVYIPNSLEWEHFSKNLPKKTPVKKLNVRLVWSLAASLVLLFGLNFYFTAEKTLTAEGVIKQIELPDGSLAKLNPGSSIRFKRTFGWWNRDIDMKGDVVFSVKQGNPFKVHSLEGKVEVLGTVFRVLSFENYFGVSCKDGRVAVTHGNKSIRLGAGKTYNSITQTITSQTLEKFDKTDGLYYNSTPLSYVLFVMEQVYGISIEFLGSKPYYFTGVLPIDNKEEVFYVLTETFSLQIKSLENGNVEIVEP